eukprot:scaffold206267_cov19-Tisochrysis_lutea.AAC.1
MEGQACQGCAFCLISECVPLPAQKSRGIRLHSEHDCAPWEKLLGSMLVCKKQRNRENGL